MTTRDHLSEAMEELNKARLELLDAYSLRPDPATPHFLSHVAAAIERSRHAVDLMLACTPGIQNSLHPVTAQP